MNLDLSDVVVLLVIALVIGFALYGLKELFYNVINADYVDYDDNICEFVFIYDGGDEDEEV